MVDWRRGAGVAMRLFLVVFLLGGLGLIVFGLVLESEPKSLPSLGLISVGVLTLVSAMFGYCGSYGGHCCLKIFLATSLASLALQSAFVLAIHLEFEKVLQTLDKDGTDDRVRELLKAGKWIFVAMLAVELLAFFIAILLRCCRSRDTPFDTLEDPPVPSKRERERERSNIALQKLRSDIGRSKEDSASNYERVRAKMQKKYGKFSHGVDWGKKKRWWFF